MKAMQIKSYWLGYTTAENRFTKAHGWIRHIRFYPFGITRLGFNWQNNPIKVPTESEVLEVMRNESKLSDAEFNRHYDKMCITA